jgi:hypothetical protein
LTSWGQVSRYEHFTLPRCSVLATQPSGEEKLLHIKKGVEQSPNKLGLDVSQAQPQSQSVSAEIQDLLTRITDLQKQLDAKNQEIDTYKQAQPLPVADTSRQQQAQASFDTVNKSEAQSLNAADLNSTLREISGKLNGVMEKLEQKMEESSLQAAHLASLQEKLVSAQLASWAGNLSKQAGEAAKQYKAHANTWRGGVVQGFQKFVENTQRKVGEKIVQIGDGVKAKVTDSVSYATTAIKTTLTDALAARVQSAGQFMLDLFGEKLPDGSREMVGKNFILKGDQKNFAVVSAETMKPVFVNGKVTENASEKDVQRLADLPNQTQQLLNKVEQTQGHAQGQSQSQQLHR